MPQRLVRTPIRCGAIISLFFRLPLSFLEGRPDELFNSRPPPPPTSEGRTDGLNIWAVQSRAVVHQIEPPLHSLLEVCQLCQNRNWCFIIAAKALIRNLNYPNPSPSLARLTTTSHATRPRENTTAGTMQQSVC